jgi:hypothetical protein
VVKGDLTTPGIVIEEGAKLKGRIVIGSEDEAEASNPRPEATRKGSKSPARQKSGTDPGQPAVAASA